MASKWERELVAHLTLASQAVDAAARWPYPAPVSQYHPDWCCEHRKAAHKTERDWITQCLECGPSRRAHVYSKGRDWAIDAAYPDLRVAVEYEGIVWAKKGEQVGRHQTGAGMTADLAKYLWLQERGWVIVRVGQRDVSSGYALTVIQTALKAATAQSIASSTESPRNV